jgi:hypothetical protein
MGALLHENRKDVPQNPIQLKHPKEAKQDKFIQLERASLARPTRWEPDSLERLLNPTTAWNSLHGNRQSVLFLGNIIEHRAITN